MTAPALARSFAILADDWKRADDPLSYDRRTLGVMVQNFDAEIKRRTRKIEKIKTSIAKRAALEGQSGLSAAFKRFAHDFAFSGDHNDQNRLKAATLFSSSQFGIKPSLASSPVRLKKLQESAEYKALVDAAEKNNVHIAIVKHGYGSSVDIDITKASDSSPKQARTQAAPKFNH